jgi:hypothetical protein
MRSILCVFAALLAAAVLASCAGKNPGGAPPLKAGEARGETLYNGIVLPKEWPPRRLSPPMEPEKPPYLVSPPAVIPIHVGRQLFVDDFLIESTTLKRTFHRAEYHPENPVHNKMAFSGGVWWDPKDQLVKLFASSGLTTSKDGVHFDPPVQTPNRGGDTVWLDSETADPQKRWVSFGIRNASASGKENICRYFVRYSPDGLNWGDVAAQSGNYYGDRSSAFYNPFRKVWVYSIRWGWSRMRKYWEVKDLAAGPYWPDWKISGDMAPSSEAFTRLSYHKDPPESLTDGRPSYWTCADSADFIRPDLGDKPQLYNLDAVPYESLMLGYFSVWRGEPDYRLKICDVVLGYSRDGWHWDRPDRRPFLPVSDRYGDWNYLNVQSVGGGCVVMGDKLYFYCSGRSNHGNVTGLATLRRDGFASMDAGPEGGTLTTRPLNFVDGNNLFVNVDCPEGELRAEILIDGKPFGAYTAENCIPIRANSTIQQVRWKGADTLSFPTRCWPTPRIRFHLKNGSLYSFWVSPDSSGASRGFVASGGPGIPGSVDTVGIAAYKAVPAQTAPKITPKPIEADAIPPIRTAGEPSSMQPPGTKRAVLRLVTHENAVCKYATKPGVDYDDMPNYFLSTGGMVHATPVTEGLADGKVAYFYVKARDEVGHTDEDDYRIDVGVKDEGGEKPAGIELIAADAALDAPLAVVEDEHAAGGKCIVSTEKFDLKDRTKGTATWKFTAPSAGDYAVWARVMGPDGMSDSYFVSMDGGPEDVFMTGEWGKWHWCITGGRDGVDAATWATRIFQLTKGEHTLVFRGRKPGCRLDRIAVTNDPSLGPDEDGKLVSKRRAGWPTARMNPVGGAGPADPVNPFSDNGELGFSRTGTSWGWYEPTLLGMAGNRLAAPMIYPAGGLVTSPTTVAFAWYIAYTENQTEIRYTTDGSEPGKKSPLYTVPFLVTETCTVKARAFRAGAKPSAVASAEFQRGARKTPLDIFSGEPDRILPAGMREIKIKAHTKEWTECRYAFERGVDYDKMPNVMKTSGGVSHTAVITDLKDGEVKTVFIKSKDFFGNVTQKDYEISVGVAEPGVAKPFTAEFEAESAKLSAPMKIEADEKASGGKYVVSAERDKGKAAFAFTAPAAGDYIVWARVFGPSFSQDSLTVGIDGGGDDVFDTSENNWGKWHWIAVNGHDNRGVAARSPRVFVLGKGDHTLVFRGREPDCRQDKVIVTSDKGFVPKEAP